MITPIVLTLVKLGRTKVVIIHHGIYCIFPLVIDISEIQDEKRTSYDFACPEKMSDTVDEKSHDV